MIDKTKARGSASTGEVAEILGAPRILEDGVSGETAGVGAGVGDPGGAGRIQQLDIDQGEGAGAIKITEDEVRAVGDKSTEATASRTRKHFNPGLKKRDGVNKRGAA